jgi:hypothetical protein
MNERGYGPIADGIGTLFWIIAIAAFTSPVWFPFVAFAVGVLVGS